jgi:dTDP-4-amino-4,6-dideoxygalactose transaminase
MLTPLAESGKIALPYVPQECEHNSHMFYILTAGIEERTALSAFLKGNGIGSAFHYVPLHSSPAGKKFGIFIGNDIYTTKESEKLLRLPMYYDLSSDDASKVVELIYDFYKKG